MNRVVLLLTAMLSFVLPLCVITLHKTVTLDVAPTVSVGNLQMEIAEEKPEVWQIVLPIIFIIGVVATLGYTLASILKVMLLIRKSERHPQPDGTILCVTGNTEVSPFSWMRYIVMNRSDYEEHDAAILAHERGHIRLRHSCDVVLVDLLTALQWFNPAMWMLRQDLRAIHEYEADGEVLSQGINARQYQYLLITKAASIGGYSIANGINHSTLKNRITMMLHKKSNSSRLLKLLALAPIVGIALAMNARTVTDYVYDEPQKQVPIKKGKKAGTINMGAKQVKVVEQPKAEKTTKPVEVIQAKEVFTPVEQMPEFFDVVEQMPEYPGGSMAMFEYLSKNIHYPKDAEEQQLQGRVIATFVVMKDGSISNAKVVKSVSPSLDEEALRCINGMPNWTPGRQNGKAVNVKYTIPISFRLDKAKEAPKAETNNVAAKDVISRLPGAKIDENGKVTINGKVVNKIIVDGKAVSLQDE